MHTEVFDNIDLLVKMSDSKSNIDDLNTELLSLKRQIENKKEEIEDLNNLINDSRYFDASLELVDKNIEISLKNKIKRLNKKIKGIKNTIEQLEETEKSMHENITDLTNKLNKNESYVETLRVKADSTSNNKYYQNLLDKELDDVKSLNKELDNKNAKYQDILKELELNNQAYDEITNLLENEKSRLNDILDNLNNPNSYIDEDLKNSDQNKLDNLNEDLTILEKRKVELLTDAVMIGASAKDLIINNDNSEALNKIKELVTIVKSKPYMDISDINILDEELEKKEAQRVELANIIDNKNYNELNSGVINDRIEYVKEEIEKSNKLIETYQNKITDIDNFVNDTLGNFITKLEEEIKNKEIAIEKFSNMLKDKNKSLKTLNNINNTKIKYEKEKKILDNILSSYKDDLVNKIDKTNKLNNSIINIQKDIESKNKEIEELNKLALVNFKDKDFMEEENDKEKLKALNEEIRQIKNRQEFRKMPEQIYDEIEMMLDSFKTVPLREEKNKDLNNLELDIENNENNRIKVVNMIPVETVKNEETGGI